MIDVAAGNKIYYYHYDGLGSVVALSDVNSEVVELYEYDVFGQPTIWDMSTLDIVGQSTVGNPYMFTGRRLDAESGLYYYRFRYYDPYTGRFLQTDPIGYYYSMNLYEYCFNDPINWIDPYGLWSVYGLLAGDASWEPTPAQRKQFRDAFKEGCKDGYDLTSNGIVFGGYLPSKRREDLMRRYGWVGNASEVAGGTAMVTAAAAATIAFGTPATPTDGSEKECPTDEPLPPGHSDDWEKAPASRESQEGDNWWDPSGGEWHWHPADKDHPDDHWDHNPWDNWNSEWRRIPK